MTEEEDKTRHFINALKGFLNEVPDDVIEQYHQRIEFQVDNGRYEKAKLHTPNGGEFLVGPVNLWGSNYMKWEKNVDVPIEKVPQDLRDNGLRNCELTVFGSSGMPLIHGPLKDDGNRQDSFGTICVAVVHGDENQW